MDGRKSKVSRVLTSLVIQKVWDFSSVKFHCERIYLNSLSLVDAGYCLDPWNLTTASKKGVLTIHSLGWMQITNNDGGASLKACILDQKAAAGLDLDIPGFNAIDTDGAGRASGHLYCSVHFVPCWAAACCLSLSFTTSSCYIPTT